MIEPDGRRDPVHDRSFWRRLLRGSGWTWVDDRFRDALPPDLDATVMSLESRDRHHAKQGRSTARFVFHAPSMSPSASTSTSTSGTRPLSVYLKRHYRLPWGSRLAALVDPGGRHTPGTAEWRHLERVRGLGIAVPEVVAAGERIGPWGRLQSFLMIADLVGCAPLHEAIPLLSRRLDPRAFAAWKRDLIAAMAQVATTLHRSHLFHKDFYLCHFFLDPGAPWTPDGVPLTLIDLHRLGRHPLRPGRWMRKDLGQLLFSTFDVDGIDDRDRLRFWKHYRKQLPLRWPRWQARMIALKAARYRAHNEKP